MALSYQIAVETAGHRFFLAISCSSVISCEFEIRSSYAVLSTFVAVWSPTTKGAQNSRHVESAACLRVKIEVILTRSIGTFEWIALSAAAELLLRHNDRARATRSGEETMILSVQTERFELAA